MLFNVLGVLILGYIGGYERSANRFILSFTPILIKADYNNKERAWARVLYKKLSE